LIGLEESAGCLEAAQRRSAKRNRRRQAIQVRMIRFPPPASIGLPRGSGCTSGLAITARRNALSTGRDANNVEWQSYPCIWNAPVARGPKVESARRRYSLSEERTRRHVTGVLEGVKRGNRKRSFRTRVEAFLILSGDLAESRSFAGPIIEELVGFNPQHFHGDNG